MTTTLSKPATIPLAFSRQSESDMKAAAESFRACMTRRRSVRNFSDRPIPKEVIRDCIGAAAQAPSGANKQPWTFVVVTDPALKRRIREGAEAEEHAFYGGRAPQRWLEDLEPFGTGPDKPFLEIAPALIAVFARRHGEDNSERHYYVNESVGLATGFLLAALHHAGLATLTHTPSPMGFLGEILERPQNERAYLLVPIGYPADGCRVPDIQRRPLEDVMIWR